MNWDSSCLTTRSSGPVSILNWTMMRFPIIVRLFVSGLQAVGSHRSFAHSIVLCTRSRNYQINTRRYWPWRERARIKERCTSHASHSREKLTKWEMECWVKHRAQFASVTLEDRSGWMKKNRNKSTSLFKAELKIWPKSNNAPIAMLICSGSSGRRIPTSFLKISTPEGLRLRRDPIAFSSYLMALWIKFQMALKKPPSTAKC